MEYYFPFGYGIPGDVYTKDGKEEITAEDIKFFNELRNSESAVFKAFNYLDSIPDTKYVVSADGGKPMLDNAVIQRLFADFNGDGKINSKDILYIGTDYGLKAPVWNNKTGKRQITPTPVK